MWFLLALIVLPLVEIALFVQIGGAIGLWPTLGIVIATGLGGVVLLRTERYRTLADVQTAIARDSTAAGPLAHAALRVIGGALLVLPGFLSDLLGALLLIPPLRALVLRRFLAHARFVHAHAQAQSRHDTRRAQGDVIEGEYEVHAPRNDSPWRDDPARLPDDGPQKRH